jgi:hypothetical protein
VWEEYVKGQGSLKGKQARDLVYVSVSLTVPPPFLSFESLTGGHFSRTIAEAWIVLQVANRHNLGVNVDYKTAQREGE